jgi:diguanylate cyclase (GGDEF)-like protein
MPLQMSASVGVATYPADGDDGQALLRRADMALYRAKEEGRNRVVVFTPEMWAGTAESY